MIRTETFKSLVHRAITAYVCDIVNGRIIYTVTVTVICKKIDKV